MMMTGCSSIDGVKRAQYAKPSDLRVWNDAIRQDTAKMTLRIDIQVKDKDFSGLCILKNMDNQLKGTVVNDMGAKAFDFILTGEGCQLLDVNSMLDKAYIIRTVEDDLHFLFEADNPESQFYADGERFEQDNLLIINYKKKQIVKEPSGAIVLSNLKYGVKYKLRRIAEIDRNKIIL
jgi:hypothetical protein